MAQILCRTGLGSSSSDSPPRARVDEKSQTETENGVPRVDEYPHLPVLQSSKKPSAESPNPLELTAQTMQSAITLANWFTAETLRVYTLLAMSSEERLAMELETWIASRGGKTTLEKIMKEAPEKLRQSEADARALLKILSIKKRGHWATMVIMPINLSAAAASPPSTGKNGNEFHLEPITRAA